MAPTNLGIIFFGVVNNVPSSPETQPSVQSIRADILAGKPAVDLLQQAKVPALLQKIILGCLEHSPIDRYHSAFELAHDLNLYSWSGEHRPYGFPEGRVKEAIVDLVAEKGFRVLANGANAVSEVATLLRRPQGYRACPRGKERLCDLHELEQALASGLAHPLRCHVALSPSRIRSLKYYLDIRNSYRTGHSTFLVMPFQKRKIGEPCGVSGDG